MSGLSVCYANPHSCSYIGAAIASIGSKFYRGGSGPGEAMAPVKLATLFGPFSCHLHCHLPPKPPAASRDDAVAVSCKERHFSTEYTDNHIHDAIHYNTTTTTTAMGSIMNSQ